MMAANWLTKIFSTGAGAMVEKVGGLLTKAQENHLGKRELALELQTLVAEENARVSGEITAEITAKERIIIAELQQGSTAVKMARPSIIYVGLALMCLNYGLIPLLASLGLAELQKVTLPVEFWAGWTTVVGIYAIGRTAEKRGLPTNGIGIPKKVSRMLEG